MVTDSEDSRDKLDNWGYWYAGALSGAAALPEDPDHPHILPDVLSAMIELLSGETSAERFHGLSCAPPMVQALESAKDRLLGLVLEEELREGLREQVEKNQRDLDDDA